MGVRREIRLKMSTLGPTQAARSRRLHQETPVPTWMTREARSLLSPWDFRPTQAELLRPPQLRHPLPGPQSWGEGEETGTPQTLITLIIILDRVMVIDSAQPLIR